MERNEELELKKHRVLKHYYGYTEFRPGQDQLIDGILAGRDVFGIMPTGGGKSLCYQVPGLILPGITLVISPLISLMRDQVMALKGVGVPAAYINSTLNGAQIRKVYHNLLGGMYKIVYVAPERLTCEGFQEVAARLPISLLAVDEAHCISQWGQDFRPSYLKIPDFIAGLSRRPVVAAFTATATKKVQEDIVRDLDLHRPRTVKTGFDRPNLYFEVRHPLNKEETLLDLVRSFGDQAGIVYCSTRKNVETVCGRLQEAGFSAARYHAGLEEQERTENQEDFLYDRVKIMVATNAFGMGIDKPNVRFVIHYNMPKSLESYYQEAGRAGRDGENSQCILLYSPQDVSIAKFLINKSQEESELDPMQQEQVRIQDLRRLDAMVRYCTTDFCLRSHILSYFGENAPEVCGSCGNCLNKYDKVDVTAESRTLLMAIREILEAGFGDLPLSTVIRVLQGFPVPQALPLMNLAAFGRMKSTGSTEIRTIAEALERSGYLTLEGSTQKVTQVNTEDSLPEGSVTMLRRKSQVSAAEEVESGELLTALKELRAKLAKKSGIPPESVFSEKCLREMARKKPTSLSRFKSISGVGEIRASWYGRDFVQLIKKYK